MKRNLEIKIRFTKEELETLSKKVKKTALSREGYIRNVLNGKVVKEAPTAEFYQLIREMRSIGNNLNQILKIANSRGLLDVPKMRKGLQELRNTEKMLWSTFSNEELEE